jgi:hypothetical protein
VPANAGGFGDVTKATDAFFELEIAPLQSVFLELNETLGTTVVRFNERPAQRPDHQPLTTGKGGSSGPPFLLLTIVARPASPRPAISPPFSPSNPRQTGPAAPPPRPPLPPSKRAFPRLARALFVSVLMHPPDPEKRRLSLAARQGRRAPR